MSSVVWIGGTGRYGFAPTGSRTTQAPADTRYVAPTRIIVVGSSSVDTTAPTVTIASGPDHTKISSVSGQNITNITFTVDADYQAYEIRAVPSAGSPVASGSLIESGTGGSAGVARAVDVTSAELAAASQTDGVLTIKVFAQDLAGNWSL